MRLGRIQNNYTEAGFALVKEQGLDFIEICCNNAEEAQRLIDAKESVKALVEATGIPISSVGRWNHDLHKDGAIDKEKAEQYIELLKTAIYLGAKTFVCGCNYDNSISLLKNYENAVEFFGMLCDIAKGSGVKVAIQNCDWNNFVVSEKHWEVVLGALPELYIKYDASHAYNRGEDYLAVLSNWGERVAHVHIKGTTHAGRRGVDDPPAGMDDINWSSLFSILYARKYDGDLSIEPHSATWLGELGNKGVLFTRDFIRKYML
jgi:sugar phosphate isomerase/epimerase